MVFDCLSIHYESLMMRTAVGTIYDRDSLALIRQWCKDRVRVMKVGIAVWNGRVSPVFDVARQVRVFEIENGQVARTCDITLPGAELRTQADAVAALNLDALICGALSRPMATALAAAKTRVVAFAAGDASAVLEAWLAGRLPDPRLCMPGCGRRQELRCRRRRQSV
jgi:predicted Fe-Mo cluster-binding NifX family protein